ncbi:MAG: phosphotransferase enzyme family protein [Acidimicrobiales bacterium]
MTTSDNERAQPDGLVHGMVNDLVVPDWPAITAAEVTEVLGYYVEGPTRTNDATVLWRSPRPMSAAALVELDSRTYFLKRHDVRVRSRERLALEHAFVGHLRSRGLNTPAVLAARDGSTVHERGRVLYEVYEQAVGVDHYRDVPSWHPFLSRAHAGAAGAALARFHRAAAGFDAAASGFGPLLDSVAVVLAPDPATAYRHLVTTRPGLVRATAPYDVLGDYASVLAGPIESAASQLGNVVRQWTHGDWHGSNLTWRDATPQADVASVLDLGLSNRTFALHDLAIAIERSTIDWLDTTGVGAITVDYGALDALLEGYDRVVTLTEDDLATLSAVLPIAHVEFALSEVEYFGGVLDSSANVELAYQSYLLGHVEWFDAPAGIALRSHLGAGRARKRA